MFYLFTSYSQRPFQSTLIDCIDTMVYVVKNDVNVYLLIPKLYQK
jgi:hypothetical protein